MIINVHNKNYEIGKILLSSFHKNYMHKISSSTISVQKIKKVFKREDIYLLFGLCLFAPPQNFLSSSQVIL